MYICIKILIVQGSTYISGFGIKAGFVTAPDLAGVEALTAPQRLELIKANRDVILAYLVRRQQYFLGVSKCKQIFFLTCSSLRTDSQLILPRTLQVCTDLMSTKSCRLMSWATASLRNSRHVL